MWSYIPHPSATRKDWGRSVCAAMKVGVKGCDGRPNPNWWYLRHTGGTAVLLTDRGPGYGPHLSLKNERDADCGKPRETQGLGSFCSLVTELSMYKRPHVTHPRSALTWVSRRDSKIALYLLNLGMSLESSAHVVPNLVCNLFLYVPRAENTFRFAKLKKKAAIVDKDHLAEKARTI